MLIDHLDRATQAQDEAAASRALQALGEVGGANGSLLRVKAPNGKKDCVGRTWREVIFEPSKAGDWASLSALVASLREWLTNTQALPTQVVLQAG